MTIGGALNDFKKMSQRSHMKIRTSNKFSLRNVLCEENPSLASPFTLLGIETSLPAVCSPFERGAHL
jgi:hypothetical protein